MHLNACNVHIDTERICVAFLCRIQKCQSQFNPLLYLQKPRAKAAEGAAKKVPGGIFKTAAETILRQTKKLMKTSEALYPILLSNSSWPTHRAPLSLFQIARHCSLALIRCLRT